MADVGFLLLILALFAVARLLVAACDRIIGPDEVTSTTDRPGSPEDIAA